VIRVRIPSSDSAPKHGLRAGPRSHGQHGCRVRVEERRLGDFLDLRQRSSLSGNAQAPPVGGKVFFIY
jgi:hypothetical protein